MSYISGKVRPYDIYLFVKLTLRQNIKWNREMNARNIPFVTVQDELSDNTLDYKYTKVKFPNASA